MKVHVKILSYKSPQRFAVKRTLLAAHNALRQAHPQLELAVEEVRALDEIEKITQVVILPSLLINDRLVCVGRFPGKDELTRWLEEALAENGRHT